MGIDVTEPYNGTYDETIARCMKEREADVLPELKDAVDWESAMPVSLKLLRK